MQHTLPWRLKNTAQSEFAQRTIQCRTPTSRLICRKFQHRWMVLPAAVIAEGTAAGAKTVTSA